MLEGQIPDRDDRGRRGEDDEEPHAQESDPWSCEPCVHRRKKENDERQVNQGN